MNSLYFNPTAFVDNLSYMGVGMLGVFLIIGIIVVATSLLKVLTTKKTPKDE